MPRRHRFADKQRVNIKRRVGNYRSGAVVNIHASGDLVAKRAKQRNIGHAEQGSRARKHGRANRALGKAMANKLIDRETPEKGPAEIIRPQQRHTGQK